MIAFPATAFPEYKTYSYQELLNLAKFLKEDVERPSDADLQGTLDGLAAGQWGNPLVLTQTPDEGEIVVHAGANLLWVALLADSGEVDMEDGDEELLESLAFPVVVYAGDFAPDNISAPAF